MKHGMHEKSGSSYGKSTKSFTPRGEAERMKKTPVVDGASGLMKHNVTPRKGKGEF